MTMRTKTKGAMRQTDAVDVVAVAEAAACIAAAAAAVQCDGPRHRHTGDGDDDDGADERASDYSNEAAAAAVNC